MLVGRILAHFDERTQLHINVNDVRDQLQALGVADEIRFRFVKMDSSKIRGIFHRYTRSPGVYAEPVLCADIIISDEMDEDWKRLVAVKELLHLTDNGSFSASSNEAVNIIFHNFSIPPELRQHEKNGEVNTNSFLNDKFCILFALAILVPRECRNALRDPYNQDRLSAKEIAGIAKIPARYVPIVLANDFDEKIALLLEWDKRYSDKK